MQKFSDFSKKIQTENHSLLLRESQDLSLLQETEEQILTSINVLCDNIIITQLIESTISDDDIKDLLNKIANIPENEVPLKIEIESEPNKIKLIIDWDGEKATLKLGDYNKTIPGIVTNVEALKGAVEGLLQDFELDSVKEEFSPADLDDAIFNMPDTAESLSGYELKIGSSGDVLTIDWEDPKSGVLNLQLNGKTLEGSKNERVYDYDTLKQVVSDVVGKLAKKQDPEAEPEKEKKEITPEIKKKLAILKTVIRPRLINKFANSSSDNTRIYNAIKNYLESGEDEEYIKTELDQRAIIDFCLDLLDVILSNKNLSGIISRDAAASSLGESLIVEAKSKKKKSAEETVDVKLDMLLRLGLVDKKIYARAKKALSNKKNAGTVPYLRNLLFDLLDKLISYIKKDSTLYNRIRLNVMKEMKSNLNSSLPLKKEIEEASCAGRKAAEDGEIDEVPEAYAKHYFTKEAWLEGYNSYVPSILNQEGEDMKTFKQFKEDTSIHNESVTISEIDTIINVLDGLAGISEVPYPSMDEALTDISQVVSELGLTFNTQDIPEEGQVDLPLDDMEGQAKISVFGGESVEDKVEGELSLRLDIQKTDSGVIIDPVIMVSFDGKEAMSLSDIEFEVDMEDGEEESSEEGEGEEDESLTEEFIDGETFSVILFKPTTRRFFTAIISAKSQKEVEDIVATDYPEYTINAIYPVKVTN